MAYTSSFIVKGVSLGNQSFEIIRITADAASGTISTGLQVLNGFTIGAQSCTTTGFRTFMNADEANSNTVNGQLGMSGAVDGDVWFATVYGR